MFLETASTPVYSPKSAIHPFIPRSKIFVFSVSAIKFIPINMPYWNFTRNKFLVPDIGNRKTNYLCTRCLNQYPTNPQYHHRILRNRLDKFHHFRPAKDALWQQRLQTFRTLQWGEDCSTRSRKPLLPPSRPPPGPNLETKDTFYFNLLIQKTRRALVMICENLFKQIEILRWSSPIWCQLRYL